MQVCDEVRARLGLAVERVASRTQECARSPGRDFTRRRKPGLRELLWLIATMGTDTLGMELPRASGSARSLAAAPAAPRRAPGQHVRTLTK